MTYYGKDERSEILLNAPKAKGGEPVLEMWKDRVVDWFQSGLNRSQWVKNHPDVSETTFRRWTDKVFLSGLLNDYPIKNVPFEYRARLMYCKAVTAGLADVDDEAKEPHGSTNERVIFNLKELKADEEKRNVRVVVLSFPEGTDPQYVAELLQKLSSKEDEQT